MRNQEQVRAAMNKCSMDSQSVLLLFICSDASGVSRIGMQAEIDTNSD